jgi:L-amino acid N-acyltransferase YncA
MKPKPQSAHSRSEDNGVGVDDGDGSDDAEPVLYDWEGNWLPAPVEWEGRKGYKERNFYQRMDQWRFDIRNYYPYGGPGIDIYTQLDKFVGEKPLPPMADRPRQGDFVLALGDIAPRSWVPLKLEEQYPQEFWKCYGQMPPLPFDSEDIPENPWWEMYAEAESAFLQAVTVPAAKLDPKDECFKDEENDNGSAGAMEIRDRLRRKKEAQKRERKEQRRTEKILAREKEDVEISRNKVNDYLGRDNTNRNFEPESRPESIVEPDKPEPALEPKVNLFLRPIRPADIFQIVEIYNWHRNFGLFSPEDQDVSRMAMENRIDDIDQAGLPWIVAIEKSGRIRGKRHAAVQEKVVGFVYVDDYHSPTGMWRYTGELEIFVHDEYRGRGVGSCLLDKMIQLLDPAYKAKGGYDWKIDEEEDPRYMPGGGRDLGTIICHLPYAHGDIPYFDRMAHWFAKFDILQRGNVEMGGLKGDKM